MFYLIYDLDEIKIIIFVIIKVFDNVVNCLNCFIFLLYFLMNLLIRIMKLRFGIRFINIGLLGMV